MILKWISEHPEDAIILFIVFLIVLGIPVILYVFNYSEKEKKNVLTQILLTLEYGDEEDQKKARKALKDLNKGWRKLTQF